MKCLLCLIITFSLFLAYPINVAAYPPESKHETGQMKILSLPERATDISPMKSGGTALKNSYN